MATKIINNLWFNTEAEQAAKLYTSLFPNSSIGTTTRYGKEGFEVHHQPEGTVMTVDFTVNGASFVGLNGGPDFKFNPSISFFAVCETQDETDKVWTTLVDGGTILMPLDKYPWSERYGWLQDKYGLSWQIALGSVSEIGQAVTPTFLFVGEQCGRAEEAINFYTSVFPASSVVGILKYPDEGVDAGKVQHAQFILNGDHFMIMDSALEHDFNFNEAISLMVTCKDQEEIDYYWDKLTSDGGQPGPCGWLKDKFGVSWQITPAELSEMMKDRDPEKVGRVTNAFLKMKKFDIAKLRAAFNGS